MAGRDDRRETPRGHAFSSGLAGSKRKALSYGPESVETWCSTEMEQETFSFLWTLKGFSAFNGTEEVKSPYFKGGAKSQHQWQLKMSPKKKAEDVDYFAVHLILNSFGDGDNTGARKLKVRFQISLLDPDMRPGKQAGSATMNVCEFKRGSVWGYDKFILSNDLAAPNRRLIEEDTLRIHCRVWIEGEVKHKIGNGGADSATVKAEERTVKQKEQLAKDFSLLLRSTDFTDVAITTASKSFMAHKSILAARSKVFAAMFNNNMIESAVNTCEIPDFEEEVVEGMLEYMYTGEVEGLNKEKAMELLQIAEKYDLQGLKEECEYTMAENISVDTAAELLVVAHMYNATVLKPKVIDFINRNKEDVKKTKGFQKVAHSNAPVFVELYLSQ